MVVTGNYLQAIRIPFALQRYSFADKLAEITVRANI